MGNNTSELAYCLALAVMHLISFAAVYTWRVLSFVSFLNSSEYLYTSHSCDLTTKELPTACRNIIISWLAALLAGGPELCSLQSCQC